MNVLICPKDETEDFRLFEEEEDGKVTVECLSCGYSFDLSELKAMKGP